MLSGKRLLFSESFLLTVFSVPGGNIILNLHFLLLSPLGNSLKQTRCSTLSHQRTRTSAFLDPPSIGTASCLCVFPGNQLLTWQALAASPPFILPSTPAPSKIVTSHGSKTPCLLLSFSNFSSTRSSHVKKSRHGHGIAAFPTSHGFLFVVSLEHIGGSDSFCESRVAYLSWDLACLSNQRMIGILVHAPKIILMSVLQYFLSY